MDEFNTPMMQQYKKIKAQYSDSLVLYRMGDFYELFLDDAHVGSKVLNITLTGKSNGKNGRIPMAGVPYHAVDTYLAKLVKAGYKVAICEQLSPPNKKGLVERDVVRVVTPGTVLDEQMLARKENNHIICLDITNNLLLLSYADLSTGFLGTYSTEFTDLYQCITDEFAKLSPVECIIAPHLYEDHEVLKILSQEKGLNVYQYPEWESYAHNPAEKIKKHFKIASLEVFGVTDLSSLSTASVLLAYLQNTQKSTIDHITKISPQHTTNQMILDRASMINLELFTTIREHDPKGSLCAVIDHTVTPMGGRLLKEWIKKPLAVKKKIQERLNSVEEFASSEVFLEGVRESLSVINDLERVMSRLAVSIGNARDLNFLKNTLLSVLIVKSQLKGAKSPTLKTQYRDIDDSLNEVILHIENHIVDEPPIDIKNGGMIQTGVHKKLDSLRKTVGGSREWMEELEIKERETTGIQSLKVKYNKVFGFYIEISKSNLHLVPSTYQRRQTLVNGERFVTEELKHHEEIILTAEEKINEIEHMIFLSVVKKTLTYIEVIQKAARAIAVLDCITNFAYLAKRNSYVKPEITENGIVDIVDGRHPVVEKLLEVQQFVPNSVNLGTSSQQQLLITGPNMAGKSVFIRQVALIVLLAHMGSFVPASAASISVVDRIFVRSGASDVITSGLSTFMVEMVETAYILHHATKNSLIVMDEIGRGTSTYDGISIAWAIAEYLVSHYTIGPKTLFATHYHELQDLENHYPDKIKNYHMAVADNNGTPIFLHTLVKGGASHSFGVAVAGLAGIPHTVIQRAQEILKNLEKRHVDDNTSDDSDSRFSTSTQHLVDHLIHKELENLDISRMTPLDALNILAELKEKIHLARIQIEKRAD
jgi:DNA mismatch repair protein MutS